MRILNNEKKLSVLWNRLNEELEKGDKAAEFKKNIEDMELDMAPFFTDENKKSFKRLIEIPNKLQGKVKKHEAERILYKVQSDVMMLQDEFVIDLENKISSVLRLKAEAYVPEYQSYIQDITSFESKYD